MVLTERFYGCDCSLPEHTNETETHRKLLNVLEIIRPKPAPFGLIRIGGTADGSYLIPDDIKNVKVCFSPGVSNRKAFEDHIYRDYGIASHLCDYSSDERNFTTPLIPRMQTFDKLWLEPNGAENSIDLDSWITKFYPNGRDDLLLQMDIEGAEYRNLLSVDNHTLRQFRIICIELHGLAKLTTPSVLHSVFDPFFSKLGANFTSVHIHPNNFSGPVVLPDKSQFMSDVLEVTFVRSDIIEVFPSNAFHRVLVPHPLDITNDASSPPIVLGEYWSGGSRPIESLFKIVEDESSYQTAKLIQMIEANRATTELHLGRVIRATLRAATSGRLLRCFPSAQMDGFKSVNLAHLQEVAFGRPFHLSSNWGSSPRTGKIEPKSDFFFHTDLGWDQSIIIDLDQARSIGGLVICNRKDACFERASFLSITFSADSKSFSADDSFYIATPEEFNSGELAYLTVPIPNIYALHVKISSPIFTALHFSDLRIYAVFL